MVRGRSRDFSFVYDYETCQLLAAPIYFREDMGIEEPADGVNFHCGKKEELEGEGEEEEEGGGGGGGGGEGEEEEEEEEEEEGRIISGLVTFCCKVWITSLTYK
ncbi:hypothetical protein STEG23_005391 [Scotinomys teguina]